jgi:hypothetical protein
MDSDGSDAEWQEEVREHELILAAFRRLADDIEGLSPEQYARYVRFNEENATWAELEKELFQKFRNGSITGEHALAWSAELLRQREEWFERMLRGDYGNEET